MGPCLNCENRHYNCHSSCLDYVAYQKKLEFIRKERNKGAEYYGHLRDTKERFRRRAL